MSSYQYPYSEHYSPSPATSTTPQAFAQWDIQDEHQQQPQTAVSPLQQALPISEPSSAPTYQPPKTIQLQERPLRRVRVAAPSTPAQDQTRTRQNGKYPPTPQTNPPATATATATTKTSGKWFDMRESNLKTAAGGPVRQTGVQRSQARLASHPYTNTRHRGSYDSPGAIVMACAASPTQQGNSPDPSSPPSPTAPPQPRKLLIRTDVHFCAATNALTALLELPGVKKANLRLSLGVCPYSRVTQLTVWGRLGSAFSEEGYTVRERKYGDFKRVLVVPFDTKAENVKATLEDGILSLTYPAGTPTRNEEPAAISIN